MKNVFLTLFLKSSFCMWRLLLTMPFSFKIHPKKTLIISINTWLLGKMDKCLFLFVNFFFTIVPSHFTLGIWFYKFPVVNLAHGSYIFFFTIANIPVQIGYLTKVLHTPSLCTNALSFVYSIPDIPYSVVFFCIGGSFFKLLYFGKNGLLFCRGQRNGRVVQNGMSENDSLQVHCRYSFRAIKLVRDKTRIGFNPWYKKQKRVYMGK